MSIDAHSENLEWPLMLRTVFEYCDFSLFLKMSSNSMTKYSELIAAGRAVYAAQFRGIELNSGKSLPTLEPWYYTAYDPPSEPCMPSEQIQEAMGQANHPHKDYVLIQAADSGSTSPQTPYQNYVHKDGKAILCMNN